MRFTSYLDSYGPVRPDSFRDMAARAHAQGTMLVQMFASSSKGGALRAVLCLTQPQALARRMRPAGLSPHGAQLRLHRGAAWAVRTWRGR